MLMQDIAELVAVKKEINRLKEVESYLTKKIVDELDMADLEGQKTDKIGDYKVSFKRPRTFKVNADEYEINKGRLSACLNPVLVEMVNKYRVDTKAYDKIVPYCSATELDILHSFVKVNYPDTGVMVTY